MHRKFSTPLIALTAAVALLLTAACSQPAGQQAAVGDAHPEINWFEGSVEEAFAFAKEQDRPLFLYWGAVWCPPCHYLKNKIFKRPEFVEKSRRFVAVYLDGDTERAQALGEELGTAGYPTVIVMDPDGNEVMRMASGIPVEEYNSVLDAALSRMRPVKEVLESVLAGGVENAAPEDLQLLAFYSWGQDKKVELPDDERLPTYRTLYEGTPASLPVERSRFLALTLDEASSASSGSDAEDAEPVFDHETRAVYRQAVVDLLADRDLRNRNIYFVAFSASDTVKLLTPVAGAEREALKTAWQEAGTALEADDSLAITDRLYAINVAIELARVDDGELAESEEEAPLPEKLRDHLRDRIAWANEAVTDEGELQAVMNTMAGLLSDANLMDEAEQLIEERMNDAVAPHYYMSWMSNLKEEAGANEEALAWSRRAYDSSAGPYTRFQWGSGYLRDAMNLAPDDIQTIETASGEVFKELLAHDDAFANRNRSRLNRLENAYQEWGEEGERGEAVSRIRDLVHASCDRFTESELDDSPRDRCLGFLSDDEEAA